MNGRTKKGLKKLICAGIVGLAVLAGTREARAELIFENIPVTTAPGDQLRPAIWGNYIVWMGAENEAYDIAQGQIVQMPGLNIDGVPAIWENKVVYEGGNGYYDIDLQQMVYPEGLSVGEWPTIHNNKIVWSESTGYYDLNLEEMIYPPGLSVGDDPDIFGDKIVWSESTGYYDIGLQGMVYPEGLSINRHPAIYDNKIVWQYLTGVYYDIDLQQYVSVEGATGSFCGPDIFEDSIVWHNYDAVPPVVIDIYIWDPVCKQRQVTESGCAAGAKIYNDIVVWTDWRNGNGDIYMARIVGGGAAVGQIIYVDADATGVNDGSSWTDAYNYLQDALTVSSSGDEIWVAQGIYKPDQGAGITPGDRTATFQLKTGVVIKGGYAGFGELDANERDIDEYEAILSGDLFGDDIDVNDLANLLDEPTRGENSYHVVTGSGTDETAVLDGFTISGGNLRWYCEFGPCGGGGLYNNSGSPTVIQCTFTRNSVAQTGGGIYNMNNSNPTLVNCTFNCNSAGNGGGMYGGNPIIIDCVFSRNCAYGGGGLCSCSGLITNCTFSGNSAYGGGGMSNCNGLISNCTFIGNSADDHGGGMSASYFDNPTVTNCIFTRNSANKLGGGMYITYDTNAKLSSCTFSANSATNGNALACHSWQQQHPPNKLQLTNCILRDGGNEIWKNDNSVITITYSDVEGGWPGEGNIDADPCFVELGCWDAKGVWVDGDYHLLEDSPCIEAGDPNYVAEPNETDLDGKPRIIGGRIDMGAYEYSPAIPAEVRIVPRTINLASMGKWITCYIWLGEEYDVADIDPNSVFLEGKIQAEPLWVDEEEQIVIVRFSRSEVQGILNAGQVELTITGQFIDGTVFEGTDVIRVIGKGKKK